MLISKYNLILLFVCVIFLSFSSQSIDGQVVPAPTPPCTIKNSACPNGIGVWDIKVFDNRTLTLQLEGLERILQQINVIDQKSLSDSLGLSQGYQSSDVSRSLEIGTPPIPGITTTKKPDDDGNLIVSEEKTTKNEISAKSPALPDLITAPKYEPKFGTQSENLLQQQIDLTYKIFNLRMLLERSLTDRLTSDGTGSKLQTVLGFNVSLDPPKDTKDMAAFVEVTVTTSDGTPVSLVSLMPEEKVYNTSALSTKSNAFGGSAVFKVLTVGYSERRRGQTLYLYQDSDTLTFQGMSGDNTKSSAFGWEFRPVLGRRSVATDPRKLFAVLSIDKRDLVNKSDSTALNVTVRTYWKKYDHKTLTISDTNLYTRSLPKTTAFVFSTAKYQTGLSPIITDVKWNQLDDKNGVITIEGENFFTGTNVLIGNKVLDSPANGLTIKSDQSIQIRTTIDAVADGDLVINGRYGTSKTIKIDSKSPNIKGIDIDNFSVETLSEKTSRLKVVIRNTDLDNLKTIPEILSVSNGQLYVEDIRKVGILPVLQINDKKFSLNKFQSVTCPITYYLPDGSKLGNDGNPLKADKSNQLQKNCVLITLDVPSEFVNKDVLISFKIPLLGESFSASGQL